MSVIAAAVKHMLAAGMPADAIVAAVAEMEASQAAANDKAEAAKVARQQRNRRYYENKRLKTSEPSETRLNKPLASENASETSYSAGPLSPPKDPQTPKTPPHAPTPATAEARAHTREGWDAVRERYWDDITEIFGPEHRPGWPHATDRVTVERWLDAGATPTLIADVTRDHLARMAERKRGPPRSMTCFEDNVTAAIVASRKPVEVNENARQSPPPHTAASPQPYRNRAGTKDEHRAALAAAAARRMGHQPPSPGDDRPARTGPGDGAL